MRIISRKCLKSFWAIHAGAEAPLRTWYKITEGAEWRNRAELRGTFPRADGPIKVASGNTIDVFDIGGNNFRLIGKVDFEHLKIYVLMVLTHPEYDKGKWKEQL